MKTSKRKAQKQKQKLESKSSNHNLELTENKILQVWSEIFLTLIIFSDSVKFDRKIRFFKHFYSLK